MLYVKLTWRHFLLAWFQAKDFDSNIKWAELSDTRLFPKLAKESKKKAKSMKKVHICGRCKEGKQVKYLLDVSKAQTIPTIVMKHGVLLEESTTGRKRYWLSEAHVPLNLLKSYEEKKMRKRIARLLKKTDSGKHHAKESKCKTNKRKRSEWLSYLVSKEQKSAKRLCGHCNKDVPLRYVIVTYYLLYWPWWEDCLHSSSWKARSLILAEKRRK